MRNIKLFESFENKDLSATKRSFYMRELEKMISLPAILNNYGEEPWYCIISGTGPENLDFDEDGEMEMSKKEYRALLNQYNTIRDTNHKQFLFDDFMGGAFGIGPDYDYYDLDDKPIGWWIDEFGVKPRIAIMMKSIHDSVEYPLDI